MEIYEKKFKQFLNESELNVEKLQQYFPQEEGSNVSPIYQTPLGLNFYPVTYKGENVISSTTELDEYDYDEEAYNEVINQTQTDLENLGVPFETSHTSSTFTFMVFYDPKTTN